MMELPEIEEKGDTFSITPASTEIKTEVFDDGQKILQTKTKGNEKIKIKKSTKREKFNPYKKKKSTSLSKKPTSLSGMVKFKPYAKVKPAQHPSIKFRKIVSAQ